MDICIDCNKDKIKIFLRCDICYLKFKERLKHNWNWPFEKNNMLSKQQTRNDN